MKKWIFSLSFLMIAAHSTAHADVRVKMFQSGEENYVSPSTVSASYLVVKPMKLTGFGTASKAKLQKAFDALEHVLNSEEFKEAVINFKNKKGERAFASNDGKSNEEIYQLIMEGRETLQQNSPGEMNLYLKLYTNWFSRVIGYTTPSVNTINMNWKYFRYYTPGDVAGNLMHEWLHKLGFDHRSASEHDSVPYAVGYLVEDMIKSYLDGK